MRPLRRSRARCGTTRSTSQPFATSSSAAGPPSRRPARSVGAHERRLPAVEVRLVHEAEEEELTDARIARHLPHELPVDPCLRPPRPSGARSRARVGAAARPRIATRHPTSSSLNVSGWLRFRLGRAPPAAVSLAGGSVGSGGSGGTGGSEGKSPSRGRRPDGGDGGSRGGSGAGGSGKPSRNVGCAVSWNASHTACLIRFRLQRPRSATYSPGAAGRGRAPDTGGSRTRL